MIKCEACQLQVNVEFGGASIPNGFMLYDSTQDRDVPDADVCPRFNCPHNDSPIYFSRMLGPMGSMGEEARPTWNGEGDPF